MVVSLIKEKYHVQDYVVMSAYTPNSKPVLHQYQRFAVQV